MFCYDTESCEKPHGQRIVGSKVDEDGHQNACSKATGMREAMKAAGLKEGEAAVCCIRVIDGQKLIKDIKGFPALLKFTVLYAVPVFSYLGRLVQSDCSVVLW